MTKEDDYQFLLDIPATNITDRNDLNKRWNQIANRVERDKALNPTLKKHFPNGTTVFIVPLDDPEIAKLNLFRGKMMYEAGERIEFYCPSLPPPIKLDA